MRLRTIALLAALGTLVIPAAASAHVTLQPSDAPAGGYTRLDVRVPNETADANTTKVDVQLPDGFTSTSYEPVPGWTVTLKKEKLETPIQAEGETIDEQVTRVTFTGDGKAGKIAPGEFQDFGLSLKMPDQPAGTKLTFKAVQTYDDGNVVRWIGAPGSDEPAPQVTLVAAEGEHGAVVPTEPTAAAPAAQSGDDGSDTLAIVALIAGGLALLLGGAALVTSRRPRLSA
jgi:uncharacterized protein YcnI